MTSLSQLVNNMQSWNSKYNDDYDQIIKWLAGTSDTPYLGEALSVQHFLNIKASKTEITFKDSEGTTRCDIRTLNPLPVPGTSHRAPRGRRDRPAAA